MQKFNLLILSCLLTSCSTYRCIIGEKDLTSKNAIVVSYYGGRDGFNGKKTANGEIFDENKLTAAHRDLPFGTKLFLVNPKNKHNVCVRINDRGPYIYDRDLDISLKAGQQLGIIREGVSEVIGKVSNDC